MQILSITYQSPGRYVWQLSLSASEPPVAEGDSPLPRIEQSLQEAGNALVDEEPFVQLWYRGICMGTVRADSLQIAAAEIAERIVVAYAGLRIAPTFPLST